MKVAVKRHIFFFLLAILCFITPVCIKSDDDNCRSPYKKVARCNLQSLDWKDEDWPNDTYYNFLKFCIKNQVKPQAYKKRNTAFKILQSIYDNHTIVTDLVLDTITWKDLELLCGKVDRSVYLGSIVDRTETEIGKATLFYILSNPITDITTLINRQEIVRELVNNNTLFEELCNALQQIKKIENVMLSFWFCNDPFRQASQRYYFNLPLLNKLNNSSVALEIYNFHIRQSRIFGLISKILAATLLPMYGISRIANVEIPNVISNLCKELKGAGGSQFGFGLMSFLDRYFMSFLSEREVQGSIAISSGILCSLSIKKDAVWERDLILLEKILQKKLICVASYFENTRKIKQIISANPILSSYLSATHILSEFFHQTPQKFAQLKKLLTLLKTKTFKFNRWPSINFIFCKAKSCLFMFKFFV